MLAVSRCWLHPSCHWGFLIPVLTSFFHDNTYGFIRPDRQQHSALHCSTDTERHQSISHDGDRCIRLALTCFALREYCCLVLYCVPSYLSVCLSLCLYVLTVERFDLDSSFSSEGSHWAFVSQNVFPVDIFHLRLQTWGPIFETS